MTVPKTLPKWLHGMVAPTLMLWLYAVAFGIASAMSPDGELQGRADYFSRAALAFILASWVTADARKRQLQLCYDYDGFVFFAWVLVVPVYATTGIGAVTTCCCYC
ncbi:MAG TPA: hypothetical protein VFA77_07425 [Candidatus Eisenbacteria bacterium]|nr:hypothetical protein [Candidatus Eisenbacteria bacterium]